MYKSTVNDQQKHSASHVLALAVSRLYKNTKMGIGPVTKDGFYYDFDVPQEIKEVDLPKIENEINAILQEDLTFQQLVVSREEAMNLLLQRGQIYKAELIRAIPDTEISFYRTGDEFTDLCRGPHVSSTNHIGIIKLVKLAKVHWNEDPTRPVMYRIFGKVFANLNELEEYNKLQSDLKTNNYKALATRLNLGVIFNDRVEYSDLGSNILEKIIKTIDKNFKSTFQNIFLSNQINNEVEAQQVLEQIGFSRSRSFRDYPLMFKLKNYSKSLSFSKLLTEAEIYSFTSFVQSNEVVSILADHLDKFIKSFKTLGIDFTADLITPDAEEVTSSAVSGILQKNMVSHNKVISSGATAIQCFIKSVDKFGKEWILGYIKIYPNKDKQYTTLSMNFILSEVWKYIIEKHNGKMPLYLAPVEIEVIPVKKRFYEISYKIADQLSGKGFTVRVDDKSRNLKSKIKRAENLNIPIQLVVGEKEQTNDAVAVRQNHTDLGMVSMENIVENLTNFFSQL